MKYFILFLFCSISAYNQTITIIGEVQNTNKKPLANVKISIVNLDTLHKVNTDSLGMFSIELKEGISKFTIDEGEYKKIEESKNIAENSKFYFVLEKKSNTLEEVTIKSSVNKNAVITDDNSLILSPKKLNFIPSLTGTTDVIKILQLTPGVQNSGDANGYMYVRGGDPGNCLMLYNNTPVYGTSHLLGIFPYYNSEHIESVIFDKSSLNPKYGSNLGATISVLPISKIPTKTTISGNIGLLSSQFTFSTPLGERLGTVASFRKTYIDQLAMPILSKIDDGSDVKSLKYNFSDGNLTFIFKSTEKTTYQLDSFFSNDDFNINENELSLKGNLKWKNIIITPSAKFNLSDQIKIEGNVFFSRYNNSLQLSQNEINMALESYIEDIGIKQSIFYKMRDIDFETGIQYLHHSISPQNITIQNTENNNFTSKPENFNSNEFSLFNNSYFKINKKMNAKLGLRFNYFRGEQNFYKANLEPRLAINFTISKRMNSIISYTHKNQYLNLITTSRVGIPTDFWMSSTNEIPSSSSDEFTLGLNYFYKDKFSISSAVFYNDMKNLIEYPYGLTQFNQISNLKDDIIIGTGNSYGFEYMLKKESGKLKGWLSYTLSWAYRHFEEINQGDLFFAKFDRRHNFSLVTYYEFNKKWTLGITQLYSSGNRFTTPSSWYVINNQPVKEYGSYNNSQMPNYIRTDISINYWFFKTLKKESGLSLSVFNTINIRNPIYITLSVNTDNQNKISVDTKYKTLYNILPSLNWHFKF